MGQTWQSLLFAHWRVAHDVLRPHVPERLELEEHDGSAWIGLTPFRVAGLRLRGVPPLPFLSSLLELNCRHGVGMPAPAERGTLEYFLVERYCLYAGDGELRAEIHHVPWPLQSAEAKIEHRGIAPVGLEGDPICHHARRLDVVVWSPERYRRDQ